MEKTMMTQFWHTLSPVQVATELGADLAHGLTMTEVQTRLTHHGPNRLPEAAAVSPWKLPILQLVLKTVAPTPLEWSVVLLAALAPALIVEGYKGIRNRSAKAAVIDAH